MLATMKSRDLLRSSEHKPFKVRGPNSPILGVCCTHILLDTPDIGNAMNGMVKIPNGSASTPRPSTSLHQNGIRKATAHGGASSVTHSPAPSSPTTVGKKRKKSTA